MQGRGGLGIKVAAASDKLGSLVGALMVRDGDEVLVAMEKGKIVRSGVDEVAAKGRDTQGVRFATPDAGDSIIAITRNVQATDEEIPGDDESTADGDSDTESPEQAPADGVPSSEKAENGGEA